MGATKSRKTAPAPTKAASDRHRFAAPVLFDPEIEDGYMKHYVPIPPPIADAFEAAGAKRLLGSIAGHEFRRTMHRRSDEGWCLRFGRSWLRDAGLHEGEVVELSLAIDPEPDRVDVPAELAEALDGDAEAAAAWASLTPGRQRTLAYGIARAKRPETRRRRAAAVVLEVLELVESGSRR